MAILVTISVLFGFLLNIYPQVQMSLQQPPPNQLRVDDMWRLTLTNTTRSNLQVIISGTLKEKSKGVLVEGSSRQLTIPPGVKSITYNDVKDGSVTFKDSKWREAFTRTGNAPTGKYTICIYVKDVKGIELARDCIDHSIEILSPPQLVSPADGERVPTGSSLVFTWLPPTPSTPDTRYSIKIVEVTSDQSPAAALKGNKPFFEKDTLLYTMINYPPNAPAFKKGVKYAWRVSSGGVNSEAFTFIIINDPSPGGCFQIDTTQYTVVCNGVDSNGLPKYKITNLILKNTGTNNGRTGLHNTAATNYIAPTGFNISGLTPASANVITPGGNISISFNISGASGQSVSFIVNSTIVDPSNPSLFCDKSIGVTVTLPDCKCNDCDSLVMKLNDFNAAPNGNSGNLYNLIGTLSVNAPIYGVEIQVASYNYTAVPSSCTNGITTIEQSGMLLVPGTTINNGGVQLFNEQSSGSSTTNNNASKTVKYTSSTPMNGSIPIKLRIGLPGPIPGLNPDCCRLNYKVCIRIRVFTDQTFCKSCTFVKCIEFHN